MPDEHPPTDGGREVPDQGEHGVRPPTYDADPKSRARAMQSLLVEKGIVSTDAVDEVIALYEEDIGPMRGASVVARAWTDPEYMDWLLEDTTTAIDEAFGFTGRAGSALQAVRNTPSVHNVMVCTLCSCYPWPLLGLPPTWYKMPAYRSRVVKRPREVLAEDFGLDLDPSVEVRVHDVTAELRYFVIPQRPPGTEGWSEAELADLVTRDSMIGVERLGERARVEAD